MGLFSWLFGKRGRVASRDLVWLTDAARVRGAAEAVRDALAAGKPVLVVAHFPATLAAFRDHAADAGWPTADIPTTLTPADALGLAAGPPRGLFGLVRHLRPAEFPPEDAPDSPLPVVVLERHFLREHDDRVVRFAEGLGGRAAVTYHVSLDDPLMTLYVGEWVKTALRRLGMKEDEAIDSGMVSRRIAKAQAKIAAQCPADPEADSAAGWLERNSG